MNNDDLITRRNVELVLLEKGQRSRRYKLGEIWELNFDEIREALSEYQPEIVRCKNCKWYSSEISWCNNSMLPREQTFFCADGERKENR